VRIQTAVTRLAQFELCFCGRFQIGLKAIAATQHEISSLAGMPLADYFRAGRNRLSITVQLVTTHQATFRKFTPQLDGEEICMAEKTEMAQREGQRLARREPTSMFADPFRALDRFADEMDRIFDNFGFGRGWLAPRSSQWLAPSRSAGASLWAPDVEVYQRNNELVVRADLPGLKKEDVKVDVTDNAITIQGERRQEEESERGGVYRSERSYGSFYRAIPLPEGTITDQAKATFKDGVLEITKPAPPEQVTRGRRLEIKEGTEPKK
jgi:HSP20 family protein